MAKTKKVYTTMKMLTCARCGMLTKHSIFDYENRLYKCEVCNTIHAKPDK